LIAFTAFTVQIKTAGAIAEKIKAKFPDTQICVGGPHVTAIPKESLEEFKAFDSVICGEGESAVCEIVSCLKEHKSISAIKGVITRELSMSPGISARILKICRSPHGKNLTFQNIPGLIPTGQN